MNYCKNGGSFISRNRLVWLLLVLGVGLFLDQTSKIWAQNTLARPYSIEEEVEVDGVTQTVTKEVFYPFKVIEVVPNFFNFMYKENPAAAFSLTQSIPAWIRRPMLISISVLATIFFVFWYFRMKSQDGFLLACFSFILAGALGNLADRIRLGYVIDFLDVHAGLLGYPHLHWPTFNIADSFIVVGAIGVLAGGIFSQKKLKVAP
ncbi:MAG: signal peptidase II [Myxococcales bacterium]|nr:signal peptidase II [Myxococcales bacterium]USN51736.1 MAG: signal peptidase II [Myxococcales bacterium]